MKKIFFLFILTITLTNASNLETLTIMGEKVPHWVEYTAKTSYADKVDIISEEPGYVKVINFKNGDNIKKGDIVVVLENRELFIEEGQARKALEMDEITYKKYEKLYSKELISESELFTYRQNYLESKKDYNLIEKRVDDLKIRAQVSGIVGNIEVEIGNKIEAGNKIASTASRSLMEVTGYIPTEEINNIRVNDAIDINFSELKIKEKGRITEINPFVDEKIKKYRIKGTFENSTPYLLDNIYTNVQINISPETGILIPKSSIIYYDLETYAYVIKDGVVNRKKITLGREVKDQFIVLSGLEIGETLIINDLYNITRGQKIN
ncbi:acriflavin resistance protein [Propionigenium maris DSM 9537]|uniref:Acriflavin resistance protein n=1 Tax=Propionigenium maris DSM 9537 TaxID=1123000 RepID=A0A9W6GJ96_9FUSO|nr:efflux RND transporter periplasmic adaptor subunit [Propionigenium maris]GLI55180.1 acriflavin resistance protein [Propionigenium maris DSM 9537]